MGQLLGRQQAYRLQAGVPDGMVFLVLVLVVVTAR
jgi:hypothetical protein